MKIVKVTYATKPEYAEQNKANIQAVMNELQTLDYNNQGEQGSAGPHFRAFWDHQNKP